MNVYVYLVAPTGFPQQVSVSTTSRSVVVSWNAIECIEQNGPITGYSARLRDLRGAIIPGHIVGRGFIATGLTPYTSYTFQVAGVNGAGIGPFTSSITFVTNEEGNVINNQICS